MKLSKAQTKLLAPLLLIASFSSLYAGLGGVVEPLLGLIGATVLAGISVKM